MFCLLTAVACGENSPSDVERHELAETHTPPAQKSLVLIATDKLVEEFNVAWVEIRRGIDFGRGHAWHRASAATL
jgi:hypothetical protein